MFSIAKHTVMAGPETQQESEMLNYLCLMLSGVNLFLTAAALYQLV